MSRFDFSDGPQDEIYWARYNEEHAKEELARLRDLLEQIAKHHDEEMHATDGDESNYHQMRRDFVLFQLTHNAK